MKMKCQILSLATLATYGVKCVFKCKGNCLTFLVKKVLGNGHFRLLLSSRFLENI